MADATYYVDLSDGNDTTGTGASGAPWKTIGKATTSNASHSSGDTVTVKVRPVNAGGSHTLTSGNRFATTTSHNGINWIIEPDSGEGPIICDTAYFAQTTQVGGSLTVRRVQWTGAQQWFVYSSSGQLSVTLDSCSITSTYSAGEAVVRSAAAGANVTITGCTITNYKYWVLQATYAHNWGTLTITGNTGINFGMPSMSRPMIESGFSTLTFTGNTQTGKSGCNFPLMNRQTALAATSVVITGNAFNYANAASPSSEGPFIRITDADASITGTLTITITDNRIDWTGIDGFYAILIGEIATADTRANLEAAMSGKLGQVTVARNTINTTTGGLVKLAIGVNDGVFEFNTMICTAVVHTVQLLGQRTRMRHNNIRAANLPCMVFGDDAVVEHNVIVSNTNGILLGNPAGTSYEYGSGNTVRFNQVTSLSTSSDNFCMSDYAYNIGEPGAQDNVVDYNEYYAPNGASVGRVRESASEVKSKSIEAVRAAWVGYGPSGNDQHSRVRVGANHRGLRTHRQRRVLSVAV